MVRGQVRVTTQPVLLAENSLAEPVEEEVLAMRGNGAGQEQESEEKDSSSPEEYVFEQHVREILRTIAERTRPYFRRAARSLPAGTMGLIVLVWTTWRIWLSISLLIALIAVLLTLGLVPGAWSNRAVTSLGQPTLLQ